MKWINYNLVDLFVEHKSQNKTFPPEELSVSSVHKLMYFYGVCLAFVQHFHVYSLC